MAILEMSMEILIFSYPGPSIKPGRWNIPETFLSLLICESSLIAVIFIIFSFFLFVLFCYVVCLFVFYFIFRADTF